MDTLILEIRPLSPFGTPPLGDTLFGQLCWTLYRKFGETRLRELLDGYLDNRPFAVVADAMPKGHFPRPALPLHWFTQPPDADRKRLKKRVWLPYDALQKPLCDWLQLARSDHELTGDPDISLVKYHPQPHNSINRQTGTTGSGFAPYTLEQLWYTPTVSLEIRIVFDPTRLTTDELTDLFTRIGDSGFGRDASSGLGKFSVTLTTTTASTANLLTPLPQTNAYLTLAPCAPQGCGFQADCSYYQPFTRFGRHGEQAVLRGQPFKTPLLLAAAGAVLQPAHDVATSYVGQGLGGNGRLSKVIEETVHQGYAPVLNIHLPHCEAEPS